MPLGLPLLKSSGEVLSNSRATAVTASATINTKGSWVALGAVDWERPHSGFHMSWRSESATDYLLDIGYSLDSGSTWRTVLPNLLVSSGTVFRNMYFPIYIPRGARFGARCQSRTVSAIMRVVLEPVGMTSTLPHGIHQIDSWGIDTADSGGTSIDPGATIHTKGAWVSFAGFTIVSRAKWLALGIGNQVNSAPAVADWLFDVGYDISGAGAKQMAVQNLHCHATATANQFGPDLIGWFPVNIPGNATLYVRSQCSINDATDRLLDAVVYVGR